jgi:hypothetical protein
MPVGVIDPVQRAARSSFGPKPAFDRLLMHGSLVRLPAHERLEPARRPVPRPVRTPSSLTQVAMPILPHAPPEPS